MSARGLRAMAVVRWLILLAVTAVAAFSVWTYWGPAADEHAAQHASAKGEDRYYCPMHPQIRSHDPGACPICHMTLEPIPATRKTDSARPQAAPSDVTTVAISPEKQQLIGLATQLAQSASLDSQLRVPGVVSVPESGLAQVRVRASGFVERVAVPQTGGRVTRGQPLAFIYSPEIYRAQEEFLAAARWSAPAARSATPSTGTDIARAARQALELLGLDSADIDEIVHTGKPIRALPVRAPIAGYVARFNAVLGSRAEPDMVLYEIADISSVWILASVHERDLTHLRSGMPASFLPSGPGQHPLEARIDLIEPVLDEGTRSARVRVVVPNRKATLRPGQFGEVQFALPELHGLFVPRDAVIRTGAHEYVFLALPDHRFEPRSVKTGTAIEGQIQILEGLSAGDRVVSRGSFMLDSESRLKASLEAGN